MGRSKVTFVLESELGFMGSGSRSEESIGPNFCYLSNICPILTMNSLYNRLTQQIATIELKMSVFAVHGTILFKLSEEKGALHLSHSVLRSGHVSCTTLFDVKFLTQRRHRLVLSCLSITS